MNSLVATLEGIGLSAKFKGFWIFWRAPSELISQEICQVQAFEPRDGY